MKYKKQKEQRETEQKETEQGQGEKNVFEMIRKLPKIAFDEQDLEDLGLGSAQTFRGDRTLGRGIPYVKFKRRVRYLKSDVLKYLAENRVVPKEK